MRRVRRFVRARLHRRLFVWFGFSILFTMLTVGTAAWLMAPSANPWRAMFVRAQTFAGGQLAEVWDEPERRDAFLAAAARDLEVGIVLEDARGSPISSFGPRCPHPDFWAPVTRDGRLLGHVRACGPRANRHRGLLTLVVVLGVAGATLWGTSGIISRRLVRPLGEVVRVANAIGSGDLTARTALGRHRSGEVGELGDAINDMASRIERQMADQRELLAAVSHEIRSPLARMRVLLELARDNRADAGAIDEIEREVVEVDSLVGQLLASSRLDFAALEARPLDARDVAQRSLERAGLDAALLSVETEHTALKADPTLLSRALDNLLDNAKKHGTGASALRVLRKDKKLAFVVEDSGPGFAEGDVKRVFESFVRGERSAGSSLGLGLALVQRIARAHGGDAWAENRDANAGARVGFTVLAP